ncbi:MAG: PAS domain-containing protein [Candidatus Eisenbacteria sp.]|nr:PAS domain-containing protein [Candidatus Eisenbacteria bacterium]
MKPFLKFAKPRIEKEGLVGQLGLVLLGICAVLVGLMAIFSLGAQKQSEIRSTRAYGKQICGVLATAAAVPLSNHDRETLEALVRNLAARQGLLYAAVSNSAGTILTEANRADFSDKVPVYSPISHGSRSQARMIQSDDQEIVSISAPVVFEGRQIGTAQVAVTRTGPVFEPQQFSRFIGVVAFVAFLMVGATYAYLRLVLRPLPKLIRELKRQIHDKSVRGIHCGGRGQLRELTDAWNDAVRVFHEKIDGVDQANSQLEIEKHVLEYEKSRVEAIIGFLPTGVLVTNSSGRIAMANRAAQNLLLKTDSQLLGQTLGAALGQEELDETLEDNRVIRTLELSLGGSAERVVKISITDLSTPGAGPVGSLVTLREITQQKMADRMTHEFVNHVAHEFRTPLASIRAYTEMLVDDQVDDESTRLEFYNTIAQETERLTGLIGNLLNISKMEAGSLMANRVPVKINKLISEIAGGLKAQAVAGGLAFHVDVPDPAPPMQLDKSLISVALVNLVGNALKYTPSGGTVDVSAKAEGSSFFIRVRDTGPGIKEEDLLHIFDKFYRSSNEDIRQRPGSGLGLALAQQIAFIHGGEITVTSTPGEGAEFCLTLPVTAAKQAAVEIGAEQ